MKDACCCIILFFLCFNIIAQPLKGVNYDEHKVAPYQLPDPLLAHDNKTVNDTAAWEKYRRPELLQLFADNIYGQLPRDFDSTRVTVNHINNEALGGRAILQQNTVEVFRKGQSVKINVVLFIPKARLKPAPLFLLINNRGTDNTDPSRNIQREFWPVEMVIDSGYAMAAFNVRDLAPDHKDSFQLGALRLYPEQLTASNGMRAIGAWAWGASRVMDYLITDPHIDSTRVTIVGHSRGGKAALWAAAQDKRFAMCISNCSGNTGVALSRRKFGETVAMINTSFPHWFTPNYTHYNNNESALPVDQHMLVAANSPRPVYATNASEDLWADPTGTFLSLKNAEQVYALYGFHSSLPPQPPAINQPFHQGPLAYHNRQGIHDMTIYDWRNFVAYANKWFGN